MKIKHQEFSCKWIEEDAGHKKKNPLILLTSRHKFDVNYHGLCHGTCHDRYYRICCQFCHHVSYDPGLYRANLREYQHPFPKTFLSKEDKTTWEWTEILQSTLWARSDVICCRNFVIGGEIFTENKYGCFIRTLCVLLHTWIPSSQFHTFHLSIVLSY